MNLLQWLESTVIAETVRDVPWVYPALETGHYLGIAMLVGAIMLIDLRLLGFAARLPLPSMIRLLPWVWAGFFFNVLTGGGMFIYGATNFGSSRAFWLKMALIAAAGVNAFIFEMLARRGRNDWVATGNAPGIVRLVASLSFLLWLAVVATGRWMAYV